MELNDTKARNRDKANREGAPRPLGLDVAICGQDHPNLLHLLLTGNKQCTRHLLRGDQMKPWPGVCEATVVMKTPGRGWNAGEGTDPAHTRQLGCAPVQHPGCHTCSPGGVS